MCWRCLCFTFQQLFKTSHTVLVFLSLNFIKIIRCEGKNNEAVPTYKQIYSHDSISLRPLKYIHTKDSNPTIVILTCLTHPVLPNYFSTVDKWMGLDSSSPVGSYELPLLLQDKINSVCAAQVTELTLFNEMCLQNYKLPSHFPVLR